MVLHILEPCQEALEHGQGRDVAPPNGRGASVVGCSMDRGGAGRGGAQVGARGSRDTLQTAEAGASDREVGGAGLGAWEARVGGAQQPVPTAPSSTARKHPPMRSRSTSTSLIMSANVASNSSMLSLLQVT